MNSQDSSSPGGWQIGIRTCGITGTPYGIPSGGARNWSKLIDRNPSPPAAVSRINEARPAARLSLPKACSQGARGILTSLRVAAMIVKGHPLQFPMFLPAVVTRNPACERGLPGTRQIRELPLNNAAGESKRGQEWRMLRLRQTTSQTTS
jgi:hypothetical protein